VQILNLKSPTIKIFVSDQKIPTCPSRKNLACGVKSGYRHAITRPIMAKAKKKHVGNPVLTPSYAVKYALRRYGLKVMESNPPRCQVPTIRSTTTDPTPC
jgi:hypothetical protein